MAPWFASRAFGLVSLALFSAVVVLGLLTAGRRAPLGRAFVVAGLHRSLSLLSLAFLGSHIAANVIDDYVTIRWADAVVPFVSDYRPFWLGFGAIAFDIMLVLIGTSLLRVRLGLRAWRAVHWLAYASWPIAVVHGIGVGTDHGLMLALTAVCVLAVATAAAIRFAAARTSRAVRTSSAARRDSTARRSSAVGTSSAARSADRAAAAGPGRAHLPGSR